MLSGNRLEIRFLKVLGLLAIFSFGTLGFLEWIEQPKQFFIDNFLVRGVPAVAILIFLIIFLTLKPQKYAVYLFVSIISFHLFFNLFSSMRFSLIGSNAYIKYLLSLNFLKPDGIHL
mgnify:CR=1 FL=1